MLELFFLNIEVKNLFLNAEVLTNMFGIFQTVNQGKWRGKVVAVKMMKENTMSEEAFIEEARTMT